MRKSLKTLPNRLGQRRKCYVCGATFNYFTRYRMGSLGVPEHLRKLNLVGSDPDNFGCINCGAHDRERHLFMYFDKLGLWDEMRAAEILHFAPENHLAKKIGTLAPSVYIKGDLSPTAPDVERIDATDLPFSENRFDFVIANHVLEHIPDYPKALSEFFRVLEPGGKAVLQTPYSKLLAENFQDPNICTDALRLFFYGQEDHVRIFSEKAFIEGLRQAGFLVELKRHADLFDGKSAYYHGVNLEEDLVLVVKPH